MSAQLWRFCIFLDGFGSFIYRNFAIVPVVTAPVKPRSAVISWEGNSLDIVRGWPKPIREDFGAALGEMQEGKSAFLAVRPMPSIGAGVFELKDSDENKWYRLIYLARVEDTIYVLHCFTKNTTKTEMRDLATATQRLKQVRKRLREERKNETQRQLRGKSAPSDTGKRNR